MGGSRGVIGNVVDSVHNSQTLREFEPRSRQVLLHYSQIQFLATYNIPWVTSRVQNACLQSENEPAAPSMMFWHARIHTQQMECLQLCR